MIQKDVYNTPASCGIKQSIWGLKVPIDKILEDPQIKDLHILDKYHFRRETTLRSKISWFRKHKGHFY